MTGSSPQEERPQGKTLGTRFLQRLHLKCHAIVFTLLLEKCMIVTNLLLGSLSKRHFCQHGRQIVEGGPVSSIYISGVRTSVIRSMRKVKPSESKMAAIDVQ